jgi:hypothetical protein
VCKVVSNFPLAGYSRHMGKYQDLATKIGALVDEKNAAYGNSFGEVGEFLKILYPTGIPPEAYTDALCIVRIFDKLKRIATNKDAFGESPYQDIVGYALLGTQKNNEARETQTSSGNSMMVSSGKVLLDSVQHDCLAPDVADINDAFKGFED